MAILRNRAFLLALLIVAGLAFEFWTGSRYPQLDQKAMMAGSAGLEPLGFNTVFVVADEDPLYIKILKGTVNWGKTNQRGMTFGILFGAALLTMISLFKRCVARAPFRGGHRPPQSKRGRGEYRALQNSFLLQALAGCCCGRMRIIICVWFGGCAANAM